jgi:hypothetical protein
MAERMRDLDNRCLRKRAHPDRVSALAACRGNRQLQPYRCFDCNQWHVGHVRKR